MNTDDPEIVKDIWPIASLLPPRITGTIVVAGAWKGLYVHYLAGRFRKSRVIGFEPQQAAFDVANQRLSNAGIRYELRSHGLGICSDRMTMGKVSSDGASILESEPPFETVEIKDAIPVLHEIGEIDLFVMNMEGYEYVLLPYLLGSEVIKQIKNLAVQFHPKFCNANLYAALTSHYGELIYDNYPTWSYWKCL